MKNLKIFEIYKNLKILKYILNNYKIYYINNITFINIDIFYSHLELYNDTNFSIKKIMNNIEQYIPLNLIFDIDLINIYNKCLNSYNLKQISYLKNIFYQKCIFKFFDLILNTNSKKDWIYILNSFENMI